MGWKHHSRTGGTFLPLICLSPFLHTIPQCKYIHCYQDPLSAGELLLLPKPRVLAYLQPPSLALSLPFIHSFIHLYYRLKYSPGFSDSSLIWSLLVCVLGREDVGARGSSFILESSSVH